MKKDVLFSSSILHPSEEDGSTAAVLGYHHRVADLRDCEGVLLLLTPNHHGDDYLGAVHLVRPRVDECLAIPLPDDLGLVILAQAEDGAEPKSTRGSLDHFPLADDELGVIVLVVSADSDGQHPHDDASRDQTQHVH